MPRPARRALPRLKALGVRIGIDDFGTGYSALTYLKQFPVDTLKIDQSFVDGLGGAADQRGDRAIVAGLIDLAHAFGLTTVAEGVETAEQLAQLHSLGCELAQGYFARAADAGRSRLLDGCGSSGSRLRQPADHPHAGARGHAGSSGCSSSRTTTACARWCGSSSRTTSTSSAKRPAAARPSPWLVTTSPTSCCSTSPCPASAGSRHYP